VHDGGKPFLNLVALCLCLVVCLVKQFHALGHDLDEGEQALVIQVQVPLMLLVHAHFHCFGVSSRQKLVRSI